MNAFGEPDAVLVLGGTSDIALATVRRLVVRGTKRVVLAGRDPRALERVGSTLGVEVETVAFHAENVDGHEMAVDAAFDGGDIDLALLAFGLLGDQKAAEADPDLAVHLAEVNYVAAVSAGLRVAERFRRQGHGVLVVLSSVAGERARRSNFLYGSTKAGLDAFAQGLAYALDGTGARVLIVRPGFVRTKMTAGRAEVPFSVDPDDVAEVIVKGLARGREVVWVPPVLRAVMTVLRHLPRSVFRRLPL